MTTILLIMVPFTYLFAGVWLLVKGRVLTAGIVTLLIALAPIFWLFTLPAEEVGAPGTGVLVMMLIFPTCLSFLFILSGFGMMIVRKLRRQRHVSAEDGAIA